MVISFSQYDIEKFFLEFMEAQGIAPADSEVKADGQLHRYVVRGNKSGKKTGSYVLYCDGWPSGWAMDWRSGDKSIKWKMDEANMPPLSDEEKARYAAEMAAREKAREEQTRLLRDEAAETAQAMWAGATPVPPQEMTRHGYLKKKKLREALGARMLGSNVLVPIYTPEGKLCSLQILSKDENKRKDFLTHGRTKGCFCILAEEEVSRGKYVFVCEGWATGCTIHEATGCAVIVAFYLGNLESVTATMLERYPNKLVLAPDYDYKTSGNPGLAKAFEIRDKFDIPLAIPPFKEDEKGSDWNDYAALYDIERTSEAIYSAVERWEKKSVSERESSWPVWVHVNENGRPKPTIANLEILLRKQGISVRYNEITKEAEMIIPGKSHCLEDETSLGISHIMSLCGKFGLPRESIPDFLSVIAMDHKYNPVRDWVLSRIWDGTDRLEPLFSTIKVEKGFSVDFKNLLLRRWLISCVAAVFCEGFHNRGVLVLQGRQGLGKTAWLGSLVPKSSGFFASNTSMDVREKDDVKRVLGYWIVELGEIEGAFRPDKDMSRLKAFLTLSSDELRLPYGRSTVKYPRRTVFCGSVNERQFLVDPTGNSRWWCLPCDTIDYQHTIDVQQLWAQVYQIYQNGEPWFLNNAEEIQLSKTNWSFEQSDNVEDAIISKFDWAHYQEDLELGLCEFRTAREALIMTGIENPTKPQTQDAGKLLTRLTKTKAEQKHGGGRYYYIPRRVNVS